MNHKIKSSSCNKIWKNHIMKLIICSTLEEGKSNYCNNSNQLSHQKSNSKDKYQVLMKKLNNKKRKNWFCLKQTIKLTFYRKLCQCTHLTKKKNDGNQWMPGGAKLMNFSLHKVSLQLISVIKVILKSHFNRQ